MFHLFKRFASHPGKIKDYADTNLKYTIGRPGEIAIVDEIIQGPYKPGRVYFRGSYWPASCDREIIIGPGDPVRVIGINSITLLIEPIGPFENPG